MSDIIRRERQKKSLSEGEKGKITEITKALTHEESEVIAAHIPSEILIAELSRRLNRMDSLKKEINRMYGILSAEIDIMNGQDSEGLELQIINSRKNPTS